MRLSVLFLFGLGLGLAVTSVSVEASHPCAAPFGNIAHQVLPPDVVPLRYDLPQLKVASLVDPTSSTGATLFRFPQGARVSFDARGGSVASVETTLLEEGSYSNEIDGLVFAGGSTMGLATTDGVREALFQENIRHATEFDFVPSVPGAVVFDYGNRIGRNKDPHIYPTNAFGQALTKSLSGDTFYMGRTGAGVSTTVNKIGEPFWGGQGAAFTQASFGKVFAAVVLNSSGDVKRNGASLGAPVEGLEGDVTPGKNTTLSLIVTDVDLDRNQLKRLAIMVHTGMASMIDPFHTSVDGDICFVASVKGGKKIRPEDELSLQMLATSVMRKAIENSIHAANR